VVNSLKAVLPDQEDVIPLHEPNFSGNEWKYVKECLDSGWVSSIGNYVDRFEAELEKYTGVKHAIAVVNGTAALQICLKVVGVEQGDEVLVPTLTFVATANAVRYCGATPHFIDSEQSTLGMDPQKLDSYLKDIAEIRTKGCFNKKTGCRIKAIMPMHTFGHPVDLDPLVELCRRYQLELVEDAAESLGSFYKGRHTGNWGKASALSFNGNKVITTGGGGAILTNDDELGKLAKHLTTTARVQHKWSFEHDQVGFNFRMPNINAALGCAQLEALPNAIRNKRKLAGKYQQAFIGVDGVGFFTEPSFAQSNYWLNVLLLDKEFSEQRDPLLELTNSQGIMTRPAWKLLHELDMYKDSPKMDDLTIAEHLEKCLINIPSSSHLG
jgi:perosamine synthetase